MKDETNRLISSYRDAAIEHGVAILAGNPKAANQCYAKMMKALKELKADHPRSPVSLMELLNDSNDSVAAWAATHLIRFCTDQSISTLKRIGAKEGLVAFDANMVVEEWNQGRFKGEEW